VLWFVGRAVDSLLVTMKGPRLFTHTGNTEHMPEREERNRIVLSERIRCGPMEQIDFFQGDSSADDHALHIVLHKHLFRAKGNDRNKQGVIVNVIDR